MKKLSLWCLIFSSLFCCNSKAQDNQFSIEITSKEINVKQVDYDWDLIETQEKMIAGKKNIFKLYRAIKVENNLKNEQVFDIECFKSNSIYHTQDSVLDYNVKISRKNIMSESFIVEKELSSEFYSYIENVNFGFKQLLPYYFNSTKESVEIIDVMGMHLTSTDQEGFYAIKCYAKYKKYKVETFLAEDEVKTKLSWKNNHSEYKDITTKNSLYLPEKSYSFFAFDNSQSYNYRVEKID